MFHWGGYGFDSGESPHGTLLYAGSIPARSTASALLPMLLLEGRGGRHPAPAEEYDGAIIQLWRCKVVALILFSIVMGVVAFLVVAIGQGWL